VSADLTTAELTLLGLLVEKPRHGYELEEVITERGMREWTEVGFSSIYYLLAKLRDRGLITEVDTPAATPRSGRGKARKVYGPTADGRQVCATAAEAAVAELRPVYPHILVGLANQPAIPPERLRAALASRAEAVADKIAEINAAVQPDVPRFVRAIFDYSLTQLKAEQQWLSAYQEETVASYDVKRELKRIYAPRNTDWALVDVPEQRFLAIDGHGDPNTSAEYARAVEALYAVAYTIKFASKDNGRDLVVAPLEGLWWAENPEVFTTRAKDSWNWRMLISQPDWVTDDMIAEAKDVAKKKKGLPAIAGVRRETLHEGTCAQVLHIGPYDDEGPVLARLHDTWLAENGLRMSGLHHEIYLGDPRRADPAKLRTILRQPVRREP